MDEEQFTKVIQEQWSKIPSLQKSSLYIYDQVMGFYYAVAWSKEIWLLGNFGVQLLLLLLVLFGRRFYYLQVLIFLLCCAAIFVSERINEYCAANWKSFSTQNYFDKHGVFIGIVFSAPLLLILTFQLLLILSDASKLVVKVKRHEFGLEKKKDE